MENERGHRNNGSSKRRLREVPESTSTKRRKLDSNCSITIRASGSSNSTVAISSSSCANFSATIRMTSSGKIDIKSSSSTTTRTKVNTRHLSEHKFTAKEKLNSKTGRTTKYCSVAGSTKININLKTNAEIQKKPKVTSSMKCISTANNSGTESRRSENATVDAFTKPKTTRTATIDVGSEASMKKRSNEVKRSSSVAAIGSKQGHSATSRVQIKGEEPATSGETTKLTQKTGSNEAKRSSSVAEIRHSATGRVQIESEEPATSGETRKAGSSEVKRSSSIAAIGPKQGPFRATSQVEIKSEEPATSGETRELTQRKYPMSSKDRTILTLMQSECKKRAMSKEKLDKLEEAVQEWNNYFGSSHTLHRKVI